MSIALSAIKVLKGKKNLKIIDCILFLSRHAYSRDETEDGTHINTFIFQYGDESEARINMDGDLYDEQNFSNAYNIFQ